jgi:RimJ/RimL family protein N-acetyltransferase
VSNETASPSSDQREAPFTRSGLSSRLIYRPISLADFEPYAEFLADPECTRFLLVPEPHTRELARSLLERNVAAHDGTIGMYTLLDGNELVGWAGYLRRELTGAPEVELGWLIRKEHWGKGYASEAAIELRDRGPERVIHLIHPENAASIAIARKLGATHERDTEIRGGPVAIYASYRSERT